MKTSGWGVLVISAALSGCGWGTSSAPEDGGAAAGPGVTEAERRSERGAGAPAPATAERLRADIDPARQRVSGERAAVRFEAERAGAAGARARFEGNREVLTAVIEGPRRGAILWKDVTIRGMGARAAPELQALAEIEKSFPPRTLALIALDLACAPGADKLDPAVGAALLMPWQMLLKYRASTRAIAPRTLAAESACQHFRRPADERDPRRTPSPTVVALTFERPIPMAVGYFPFDGEGQVE